MEHLKGENKKCKQKCYCMSWRTVKYRCVRLSVLLVVCSALVCGVLLLHHHSQVDARQLANCSNRQLSDQTIYDEFTRRHANLKITLLSERDEAPVLQSQHPPRPREITIVTQASVDRWPQLEKMASSWGGALCVAIPVKTRAEIVATRNKMMWLHERIEAQRHCRLHLQMVIEEGFNSETDALAASYPVNALRNVALGMATTELVFLLDVDFVPSPGMHEKLTMNEKVYSDLLNRTRNGGQLLVVPAFQVQPIVPRGVNPSSIDAVEAPIPQNMQELRERWLNRTITSFRWYHHSSHDSSSYSHFLHPLTTEPYHVQYRELYEPYIVAARALIPKYDERFRGYGKNKISHLYNCAVEGFSFVVLPEVYVWEIPHPRSRFYREYRLEKEQPCGSLTTDVIYQVFKEELRTKIRQTQTSLNLTLS